ncbi:MAG: tetratricopeptide repeat protein, partial [Chitinophagaceae bacterium]
EYTKAEADYRESQSKFPTKAAASYNLGNSIYRIKQPAEAKSAYMTALKNATSRPDKHKAFHNLGNVYMDQKDYQAAVSAYKNALINDPADEETRYNFALAKKMLKDNPPPENKNDKKDKDDKKDKKNDKGGDKDKKNDEKKDDDKNKNQKKDNQGQQDQDKKDGNQPQQKPQPRPGGISGQRMQNMLDAVNNEEKKVQDKVKARQEKGKPVPTEKDW